MPIGADRARRLGDFYIVNQILTKGLHTTDAECTNYTTSLMDKLEEMKVQHASESAITDDLVAQAYVEQFALDTFSRAENAMKANKVTNQTADTFYAAATFLELLQVWEKMTPDIHQRVKFAKHHAVRILKAIKAGEDPNASNPVMEEDTEMADAALDPNDPEVQAINGTKSVYEQPSVVDEVNEYVHPAPESSEAPTHTANHPTVPSHPPDADPGYFPQVSPSSPTMSPAPISPLDQPSAPAASTKPPPRNLSPPPAVLDPTRDFYQTPTQPPVAAASQPKAPLAAPFQTPQVAASIPPTPATPAAPAHQHGPFRTDDAAVTAAQKHAKWAISALNFEDVPTAVKELREALRSLNAA